MKNKNNIWIIGTVILGILFLSTLSPEDKKLSGETSQRSFEYSDIYTNQETTVTVTINPGTSTYYAIDEEVPSGWTVTGASDSGDYTTTPGHIFWVILTASGQKDFTYTINPNDNNGLQYFTGTVGFEELPEGPIGASDYVNVVSCSPSQEICDNIDNDCNYMVDDGVTESCGSGGCTGIHICNAGVWGDCSSEANDCGVCCICDATGSESYDETQDTDCSATDCPADGCGLGGCGTHIFSDYDLTTPNYCSALKTCTANTCTPSCTTDTDSDGWAGTNPSFSNCYDCNNNDDVMNPSETEACGDNKDNDCDGSIESYFNLADWALPSGFCSGDNCCDDDISMDELLDAIGEWKSASFTMNDLLITIGGWK
jgi:hypothetical protein